MSFLLRATQRTAVAPSLSTRAFSSTRPSQLAKMTVVGRLAAPPEEIPISNDRTLVRYALGSSYGKKGEQKTSWFRIASFTEGPQKDLLMSLPKGSLMYVEADARFETYEDKEGKTQSNLSLIARNFDVLSRPRTETLETNDEGLVQEEGSR